MLNCLLCVQPFATSVVTETTAIVVAQVNVAVKWAGKALTVTNATLTQAASMASAADHGNATANPDGEECSAIKVWIEISLFLYSGKGLKHLTIFKIIITLPYMLYIYIIFLTI